MKFWQLSRSLALGIWLALSVARHPAAADSFWTNTALGPSSVAAWSGATNWSNNVVPNAAALTVWFILGGSDANGTNKVIVDVTNTIGHLIVMDTNVSVKSWTFTNTTAGPGLTFSTTGAGTLPRLSVSNSTTRFYCPITTAKGLQKLGGGMLRVFSNLTVSACGLTISGGTLSVNTMTVNSNILVVTNTTLTLNTTNTLPYGAGKGLITNNGTLNLSGTKNQNLNGLYGIGTIAAGGGAPVYLSIGNADSNSVYSGNFTIAAGNYSLCLTKVGAGTLDMGSNKLSVIQGNFTNAGGTTIFANNFISTNGTLLVADDTKLGVKWLTATNSLIWSNVVLGSSGTGATTLEFDLSTNGVCTNQFMIVSNQLALNSAVSINVKGVGLLEGDSFPLVTYKTKTGAGSYTLASAPAKTTASLRESNNTIWITINSLTEDVWAGTNALGETSLAWSVGGDNWLPTGASEIAPYADNDWVRFDDSAGANKTTVTLAQTVKPGAVRFNNDVLNYVLQGPGKISGTNNLRKFGAATVELDLANDYSGPTTVYEGTLILNGSLGTGELVVTNGAAFNANGSVGGNVLIRPGGMLSFGTADFGTLRVTNASRGADLQGITTMKLRKQGGALTNDQLLVAGYLTNGGTLTLALTPDSEALTGGETFTLFTAGTYSMGFSNWNLPTLSAGLNWCLGAYTYNGLVLSTNGTLRVNRAPLAANTEAQTSVGNPVLLVTSRLLRQCADPDGDSLAVTAVSNGGHGAAILSPDGSAITYSPSAAFAGADQFTYTISDGHGGAATGTIAVWVNSSDAVNYNKVGGPTVVSNQLQMNFVGIPADYYVLQRCTNLVHGAWISVATNPVPDNGQLVFMDPSLPYPRPAQLFYRACLQRSLMSGMSAGILQETGVKGGVVVHVGCGDGQLTAALCANASYLVHGLERDPAKVATARATIQSQGLYGAVSAETWSGTRLPYVDGFANLVVVEDTEAVSTNEAMRVVAPLGVAYIKQGGGWIKLVKPWPAEIDEWSHYLHDASGTCVGNDTVAGPPKRLQWTAGPRYCRHHDVTASFNAAVTAKGRFFYIIDDGERTSILTPSHYSLYARDAFNGTLLWKRSIANWHPNLFGYKSGPTQLTRRLVAAGDVVYSSLDYFGPLYAIDAATGAILMTYSQTVAIEEVIYSNGVLYVMADPKPKRWQLWENYYDTNTGLNTPNSNWNSHQRLLMAINPVTGATLWQIQDYVYPGSLTADSSGVVYHDGNYLYKLALGDGHRLWQSSAAVPALNPWYTAFALSTIMYQDTVLLTDGKGNVISLDSTSGQVLATWKHDGNSINNAPRDLFVVNDYVWSSAATSSNPVFKAYNRRTGACVQTNDPGLNITWIHQRCYRSKATVKYFMPSRCGIEFVDTQKNWGVYADWTRGSCLYGIIPANGFVYSPPNNCACFYEMKLSGLNAQLPAAADTNYPVADPDNLRLETGPAYGQAVSSQAAADDWPTYRHDNVRSGYTPNTVSTNLTPGWELSIGGKLSGITVAEGKLFVSSIDAHTVWALDATNGTPLWNFVAGGRVDSPPTIYQGRVVFGCADGRVYCLRATDGALIWRFQGAPTDLRISSYDRIESVWPLNGATLLWNNQVYCVAGRSMFLDGGLRLLMLNPTNGTKNTEIVMDDKVPDYYPSHPGENLMALDLNLTGPVGLPDILSSDDQYFYMKSQQFAPDGTRQHMGPYSANDANNVLRSRQIGPGAHLFTPTGILDDNWVHRSYWVWGKTYSGGAGGYSQAGKQTPCGQILCIDNDNVYGFGRKLQYYTWTRPKEHMLFATSVTNAYNLANPFIWTNLQPLFVRAMALSADHLFIAGPPDVSDETAAFGQSTTGQDSHMNEGAIQATLAQQDVAWSGAMGGTFRIVSKVDGSTEKEIQLTSPPTWDSMAIAGGRVYFATLDGKVLCLRDAGP